MEHLHPTLQRDSSAHVPLSLQPGSYAQSPERNGASIVRHAVIVLAVAAAGFLAGSRCIPAPSPAVSGVHP